MNEYQKQANEFAEKYGVILTSKGVEYTKFFDMDTKPRYVFDMVLSRVVNGKKKSYRFKFGQSYATGNVVPDMYNVLSNLQKYDPETYEFFLDNYDCSYMSPKESYKMYKNTMKEWKGTEKLFGDIIEELREID
jgi:hypothetical protein